MTPKILNPLSISLAFIAALGVLVHDTQIYNAAKASTLNLASIYEINHVEESKLLKTSTHIHSDSGSFYGLSFQQPSNQPRSRDDKKYVAIKRLIGSSFGSEYSWPVS